MLLSFFCPALNYSFNGCDLITRASSYVLQSQQLDSFSYLSAFLIPASASQKSVNERINKDSSFLDGPHLEFTNWKTNVSPVRDVIFVLTGMVLQRNLI